jgi:hypothetical protein
MQESTLSLSDLLDTLTAAARQAGWSDAEWVRSVGTTRPEDWRPFGPPFFLAGLAVTLASVPTLRRREYLDLAEALHPGATEPRVLARWLTETPLPPSRLLPMLEAGFRSAA